MTLNGLLTYCKEQFKKHPELKFELADLYHLAKAEIEDGGSEEHECELAVESINQLAKENK